MYWIRDRRNEKRDRMEEEMKERMVRARGADRRTSYVSERPERGRKKAGSRAGFTFVF
jgi:hypothetical protein